MREDKDAFFQELECILSSVPSGEMYVLLGDFNARVGSRESVDEEWRGVRGPCGYGQTNDCGRELLSFLSLHQATVCNTWFRKKDIYKQTWQHPKSKQWSCIDYAMMRQRDRGKCLDVTVRRGAECNTDHHLLVMKLRLKRAPCGRRQRGMKSRRFDVGKLMERCVGVEEENVKERYLQEVLQRAADNWSEDAGVERKWSAVKSALVGAAEEVLGKADRRQPDWFQESAIALQPLLVARNIAYSKWLGSKRAADLGKFRQARSVARRAIRKAKNDWFQGKAEEVEKERFGGKKVWKAIRDMQRGRRGLLPCRAVTINDEKDVPCSGKEAQQQRWRRHFTSVLNIRSEFKEEMLESVPQREVDGSMADKPTRGEVRRALGKLKNGKAAGNSSILPEMLKAGARDAGFMAMLTDLMSAVWEEKCVPQEWVDAILVPIPKKGNLHCCDNWRGIALLDLVGKLAGRIVQNRLQSVAERELPESQCGFRRGRGCTDMIFVVRQLVEKAFEHKTKQFLIFVDLRKAYDSVPREAMWKVLRKLGVPDALVDIIRSFHTNMEARIRVGGELLQEIGVNNGLRQGCTMAPTLFNLYASVVAEKWAEAVEDVEDVGVDLLYKLDQQLFRRCTRGASEVMVTKGEFADDVVLVASTREAAEAVGRAYVAVTGALGLTVSFPKTKFMVVGCGVTEEDRLPLPLEDSGMVECVSQFLTWAP